VLASHVLYYVGDVSSVISRLIDSLAPGGVFLASIADRENFLVKIWQEGFKLLHKDLPYNTGEDVAQALHQLQIPHTLKPIPYQIRFTDSGDNRLKIIRFLMGEYLGECPLEPLFSLFDEHSAAGEVRIGTRHMHFVINA
jgi:trans-aconitate 2-methyltransferase